MKSSHSWTKRYFYSPHFFEGTSVITLPFESIQPQRILYVSPTGSSTGSGSQSDPLMSIQAAINLATPGTTIMVEAGTYTENVKFNVSGLPDAPIQLISADGPGAAKIVPGSGTPSATVSAFGEENIVIRGFDVSGGSRLANGIQFGMNGSDFTDMTANIVIRDNIVHDTVKDGIKVSHGDYVYVVDNTVSHVGDQGIDFVAVNNSVIARNDVSYTTGSAPALFVKAGSTNILIAQNHIAHAANDGIAVGGWSEGSARMRPGFTEWQAKNVTVIDNHVEDVGKRPLNILGGQDSQIVHNWLESNPDYYYVVTIAPDNSTPPLNSKNILLKDNAFDRGDHWLQVLPGQDVGLQVVGNRFDNVFQGATGPHSGDLDYDLAWLPNNCDHLYGTAGNDKLDGGDGADTLTGGAGNDTYIVDNTRDLIEENLNGGTDTVISSVTFALAANVENLTLKAGAGEINATGNELANALTGNEANNVLDGGLGIDKMTGGKGSDSYYVDNIKDAVVETVAVSSGGGVDTVYSSVDFTLGTNVDNLVLGGSAATGSGNALKNQLIGNDKDNSFSGFDGSDALVGGAGLDSMAGGAGNDTLDGGAGNDNAIGGAGNDRIVVSSGNDVILYTSTLDGHDVVVGFDGNASNGQDTLNLDALFDSLNVGTAARAARVSIASGTGAVDVDVDVSALGDGSNIITVATLQTTDAVAVGQDVLVGSA
jgi:Ca2+-binding RTX toxin-like protein